MNIDEFKNSTILIVDDQPKNLDVLISSLERYGFDFLIAQSGEIAIKRASQTKPDMVLLDILMPGMDGFEVCGKLKRIDGFADVPIIFMSALTETVDKLKGFELGAVDYITKPFQLEEIIARIKTHLTISSLQKKLNEANQSLEEKVLQRTKELQQEVELRTALENKYRQLVETLQEGIWALDINGNTMYVNPRLASMLGYSVEYLMECSLVDFVAEDLKDEVLELLREPVDRVGSFDFRLVHANGKEIHVSMASSVMKNEENRPIGSLIAVVDISRRKKAELDLIMKEKVLEAQNAVLLDRHDKITKINEELVFAKDKAEESDRLKTAFLANLSHEIRTPMNAIVGFAELLKMSNSVEPSKQLYIDMIVAGTLQLKDIINDIIDISKLQSKQYPIQLEQVNLTGLLDEVRKLASEELRSTKKNNIALLIREPFLEETAYVNSDPARMMDVFKKLVKNAVKFTEKGQVEIGYSILNDYVHFFVKDTGIGVAIESQKLIFEQFRQVEESFTRKFGGTGLGLAISKGFVELLGGEIWLESELGRGSTFWFSIPYTPMYQSEKRTTGNGERKKIDWKHKTILIAEDEEINVVYLREILNSMDVKLLIARDGQEAVELFSKHPETDLVLLDIKMPVLNGFEALKEIKKNSDVPVVAQTAYALSEDETLSLQEGFDAYISKPVKPEKLIEIIGQLL